MTSSFCQALVTWTWEAWTSRYEQVTTFFSGSLELCQTISSFMQKFGGMEGMGDDMGDDDLDDSDDEGSVLNFIIRWSSSCMHIGPTIVFSIIIILQKALLFK